jgi:hypothetical protein
MTDQASFRDFGRRAALPWARSLRYWNTSSAGIPARLFFIFLSLRFASACNLARVSFAMDVDYE